MKIILDAFGGDNAPAEALKGRSMAVKELGVTVLAVGDIEKMQECCKAENIDTDGIEFKQAEGVFDMHREPMDIVKRQRIHLCMWLLKLFPTERVTPLFLPAVQAQF